MVLWAAAQGRNLNIDAGNKFMKKKTHICLVISPGIPTKSFLSNHIKNIHTKILEKKSF